MKPCNLKKYLILIALVLTSATVKAASTAYAIWCEYDEILYFTYSSNTYVEGQTYQEHLITKV